MPLENLFNASPAPPPGPVAAAQTPTVSAFVTPQSLVTFPAAATVVTVLWSAVQRLLPGVGESLWVPFVLAMIVGAAIFAISTSDRRLRPREPRWVQVLIALVNSVFLFSAAIGLVSTT